MRGKIIIGIVGLGCMWAGAQKAYVAATNRTPTQLSVADFTAGKSSAVWVELNDGKLDYRHAISLESQVLKIDKGTFVPVLPKGQTSGPASVLLEIKSDEVESRISKSLESVATSGSSDGGEPINGVLQWGIDGLDSKVKKALDQCARDGQIASDYKVIKEGEEPSTSDIPVGAGMFAAPPLILGAIFLAGRKRKAS